MASDRVRLLAEFYSACAGCLREALERHVLADRRAPIEAALFRDIEPLPAGPRLVDTIELFLARLDQLRTSDIQGVQFAYAALERQGLTVEALQRVAALARAARVERERPAPVAHLQSS